MKTKKKKKKKSNCISKKKTKKILKKKKKEILEGIYCSTQSNVSRSDGNPDPVDDCATPNVDFYGALCACCV